MVADALSRRPYVNNISVLMNDTFNSMKGTYEEDEDFKSIWANINDFE